MKIKTVLKTSKFKYKAHSNKIDIKELMLS